MKTIKAMSRWSGLILFGALAAAASAVSGQTLAWEQTRYFQYNIENVVTSAGASGAVNVKVIFSVTNPIDGTAWNLKTAAPFLTTNNGNLSIDLAWDAAEFTNTGSANFTLSPVPTPTLGAGAAIPVQVRGLQDRGVACISNVDCPGVASLTNRYYVTAALKPVTFTTAPTTAAAVMEGRPVCVGLTGCPTVAPFPNVPVRTEVKTFTLAPSESAIVTNPRRQIVSFEAKCSKCHTGLPNITTGEVIPRLAMHGANRNENLAACVICHNPNQTDVPYRQNIYGVNGPETPVNFTYMIHSIHSAKFREDVGPFVVIGRSGSINDYSSVNFPGELRNCANCHVQNSGGRWSFELPLSSSVLGTTTVTKSNYLNLDGTGRSVDVDPRNDTKISPIAAACSSCHTKREVRDHMIRKGGASFNTTQAQIGVTVRERCASCHGPGKDKDVRKVHQISSSSHD
jgi:OmcA/MtrC family decaheme c-type cytochrome